MLGELALLVVAGDVVVQERVVVRGVVDDRVVGPAALEAAQPAAVGEPPREAHDPGGDAAQPAARAGGPAAGRPGPTTNGACAAVVRGEDQQAAVGEDPAEAGEGGLAVVVVEDVETLNGASSASKLPAS